MERRGCDGGERVTLMKGRGCECVMEGRKTEEQRTG